MSRPTSPAMKPMSKGSMLMCVYLLPLEGPHAPDASRECMWAATSLTLPRNHNHALQELKLGPRSGTP
jgi:hypothetical protein